MKRFLFLISFMLLFQFANAQFYEIYLGRLKPFYKTKIEFCYSSKRVDSLMSISDSIFYTTFGRIPDELFYSLSFKDQFVYAITYPESYYQSCSVCRFEDNSVNNNFIYKNLPSLEGGMGISRRQINLLSLKKDSSIIYINRCLKSVNEVGNSIKRIILDLNGVECIPSLVRITRDPDYFDTYNLTLLMKLMQKNEYEPFLQSDIYDVMYSEDKMWDSNFGMSKKNVNSILDLSMSFYYSKTKE